MSSKEQDLPLEMLLQLARLSIPFLFPVKIIATPCMRESWAMIQSRGSLPYSIRRLSVLIVPRLWTYIMQRRAFSAAGSAIWNEDENSVALRVLPIAPLMLSYNGLTYTRKLFFL